MTEGVDDRVFDAVEVRCALDAVTKDAVIMSSAIPVNIVIDRFTYSNVERSLSFLSDID